MDFSYSPRLADLKARAHDLYLELAQLELEQLFEPASAGGYPAQFHPIPISGWSGDVSDFAEREAAERRTLYEHLAAVRTGSAPAAAHPLPPDTSAR